MDLISWQIIDSLVFFIFRGFRVSRWLGIKWSRTGVGNIFLLTVTRMLTLREVSCCLLFHSKMGIEVLISDIKGLKILMRRCKEADTPMVFCYCSKMTKTNVDVVFCTSLMIDLILILYAIDYDSSGSYVKTKQSERKK